MSQEKTPSLHEHFSRRKGGGRQMGLHLLTTESVPQAVLFLSWHSHSQPDSLAGHITHSYLEHTDESVEALPAH